MENIKVLFTHKPQCLDWEYSHSWNPLISCVFHCSFLHLGSSPCKAGTMASGLAPSQGQACFTEGPADGEWCSLGTCPFQALFITWVLLFCPPKICFQASPYPLGRMDAFFPSSLYLEKVGSFLVYSPVLKVMSQLPNCFSTSSLSSFHPLLFFPFFYWHVDYKCLMDVDVLSHTHIVALSTLFHAPS